MILMARFNAKKADNTKPNATTYEGGAAWTKSVEEDWVNFLFSSMLSDTFYESAEDQMQRFIDNTKTMIEKYGVDFSARAAVFARNQLGLRSVSQLLAAIVNDCSFTTKRAFFRAFMHRPDDVSEIFGAIDMLGSRRSHALIRGAADYLSSLGKYQLAKYKMGGHEYNMYDLVNLTHAHSAAISKLKDGTLSPADTWEVNVSGAGSKEERDGVWCEMVVQGKLGYLALIRNLNNIIEAAPSVSWIEEWVCPMIVDEESIKRSLVFPYQLFVAYKNLKTTPMCVRYALDKAFRIAVSNMMELPGRTLVIMDVSGSMDSPISERSSVTIREVGACYVAALYLANPKSLDFIKFGSYATRFNVSSKTDVFNMIDKIQDNDNLGFGTNVENAIREIDDSIDYDRIFLISDMQVACPRRFYWGGVVEDQVVPVLDNYMKLHKNTIVFSYDLGNYATQISNPNRGQLKLLTSLSDKVLSMIPILESGGSLVDMIMDTSYL